MCFFAQALNRPNTLFHLPYFSGNSRHCAPVLAIQKIASIEIFALCFHAWINIFTLFKKTKNFAPSNFIDILFSHDSADL